MPPRRNDPEKDSPHMKPSRRAVITASALGLGAATIARAGAPIGNAARFSMKYAPHEGSFASRGGLVEQITFAADQRSDEQTSELKSLMRISYAVFCLKKKKIR